MSGQWWLDGHDNWILSGHNNVWFHRISRVKCRGYGYQAIHATLGEGSVLTHKKFRTQNGAKSWCEQQLEGGKSAADRRDA